MNQFALRAARFLTTNKAFAAAVVFSLGVGISVATAVVALVEGVRTGPLPFHYADRIEAVYVGTDPSDRRYGIQPSVVRALMAPGSPFEEVALERWGGYGLRDGERQVQGVGHIIQVSPNFPRLLSARMHIGRPFGIGDPPDGRYAMLSHRTWARDFHSDSTVLGRTVFVDSIPHIVVGVTARAWSYPDWTAAWISNPTMLHPVKGRSGAVTVLGLRKADIGVGQARAMVSNIGTAAMTSRSDPNDRIGSISLRAFLTLGMGPLIIALGLVALFIGLITAVNFAALVLARGIKRRAELGVRAALGASVSQLVRQIIGETVALSAIGGVLAAFLAPALLNIVRINFDQMFPSWLTIALNWRILLASVGATVVVGIVFSLGPALDLSRPALGAFLRATGAGLSSSNRATRSRAGLVAVQVGLATAFLVLFGAVLGRALVLTRPNPGYEYEQIIVGSLARENRRGPPKVSPAVLANAERLQGVTHSAIAFTTFFRPDEVEFDGATMDTAKFGNIWAAQTTEAFLSLVRPTLVAGRIPSREEFRGRAPVAIISSFVAKYAFEDKPLGKTIRIDDLRLTVIGVVDRMDRSALEPGRTPVIVSPIVGEPSGWATAELWLRLAPGLPVPKTLRDLQQRAALNQLGQQVSFRSLGASMRESMRAFWAVARIIYAIFFIALLLAAMGIYGLVSYTVEMRSREMAIREAVGASRLRISALLLRGAVVQTMIGVASGSLLANYIAYQIPDQRFRLDTAGGATLVALVVVSVTILVSSFGPLRATWRRDIAMVLRD